MAYFHVPPVPGAVLSGLARDRWAALEARRPDLRPAVRIQQRVLPVVIELADEIATRPLPRLSLPPRYLSAKLKRGVWAFAGEPIPLPIAQLSSRLDRFARELASGGAGPAAERIAAAAVEGTLEVGSLLAATLSRNIDTVRAGAVQRGLVPDLLWLVAELAVSPFAHALQQQVLGASRDETLIAALDGWDRGYCPACGSWPAVAEARQGRTILRCSFCALAWDMARHVCPFCATDGDTLETVVAEPATAAHAELCTACASYLKVIDVTDLSPFPLLAIADVETMSLDIMAMERGYTRPAIHEYRRPEANPE